MAVEVNEAVAEDLFNQFRPIVKALRDREVERLDSLDFSIVSRIRLEDSFADWELGLKATILLSASITKKYLGQFLPEKLVDYRPQLLMFAEVSDLPPEFEDAAEWMLDRGIMRRDELLDTVEFFTEQFPGIEPWRLEQQLRTEIFALSRATGPKMIARVQAGMSRAIRDGLTRTEFLTNLSVGFEGGALPAGLDGYLQNVFRTEMANSYAVQREEFYRDPAIVSNMWGIETFNPADNDSRPSHRRLDEKLFRRNSPAYNQLGVEPYSWQCRCGRAPVIVADPANPGVQESEDALELALTLERFHN